MFIYPTHFSSFFFLVAELYSSYFSFRLPCLFVCILCTVFSYRFFVAAAVTYSKRLVFPLRKEYYLSPLDWLVYTYMM